MKKFLLCFLLVLTMVAITANASSVQIETDNYDIKVNDSITLSFTLDEISKLKGLQFDILYDSESLVLNGTQKGTLFDEAFVGGMSTDQDGTIKVVIAFLEAVDFSGEICSAEFTVLDGKQNVSVSASDFKVVSEAAEEIEATELTIFVTDATDENSAENSPDELPDYEEPDIDENESVEDPEIDENNGTNNGNSSSGETSSKPSGSHSNSANSSSEKGTDSGSVTTGNHSEEQDSQKEEVLFVDSDISSMEGATSQKVFVDIIGHWAEGNILNMAKAGIVNGVSDIEFQPDRSVTRAEFATMISKVLNLTESTENTYSDVAEDAWYKDVVLQCTKAGLIKGSEGKFRPDDLISREEMAVVIYRAKSYLGLTNVESNSKYSAFDDQDEISDWAKDAVTSIAQDGIINGIGNNMFAPKSSATRAQAVVVLEKILKL